MNESKSYLVRFGAAMVAYAIVLVAAILVLNRMPESPWRVAVALVPVIPGIFAALAVAGEIGRRDELQKQIQLESLAFAAGGSAIVALSVGLLENAGVPQPNWTFFVPVIVGLWGLGQLLASRRYR